MSKVLEHRRLRVYVAGPITQDVFEGVYRGLRVGRQMVTDGLAPYVPHSDAFMFMEGDNWNSFLEWDVEWVGMSEAVYRLSGDSPGADLETAKAKSLGIPVFYENEGSGYQGLLQYAKQLGLDGVRK